MRKTVIALGFFDGVHRGHQRILQTAVKVAHEKGYTPIVVTFANQPRAFLTQKPSQLITTNVRREEYIRKQGIEEVYMLPFDAGMAMMPAEDFVRDILIGQYHCAAVVCGENYTFGAKGLGDGHLLEALGKKYGFECHVCFPVVHNGDTVSSTMIRKLIASGDVALATRLLGHEYTLQGTVVHGRGVGRRLGFPTGNIELVPGMLVPRFGVYAAWLRTDAGTFRTAINIGIRPTFGLTTPVVEFNILDFSGDLYDADIELSLVDFLRPEQTFASKEELVAQISRDVARVKEILA
ncbi:MAG: bifunctional riboflavin kinase/FAD synthetase [Clostridia bacterium]|nr:bifunctional riboflavin kinase/FAD synthetase [Clostridia bacterium]